MGAELSKDTVFELLMNRRRRMAIRYLDDRPGEATISDLAEYVAADENDTDPAQLTAQQRKRVYIALYQVHLPKLADAGVVDYEKNRGTVSLRDSARALLAYLEFDPRTASEDGVSGLIESILSR